LRLLPLRYAVQEYITAVRQGTALTVPEPQPTWLAINRRDYVVRRREISEPQFKLLQALQQHSPLANALAAALEDSPGSSDALAANLEIWFRDWTAAGYFEGVRLTL
jgi:hypothetical protein